MPMNKTLLPFTLLLGLAVSAAGCNTDLTDDEFGGIEVDTSSPTAEQPFVTADGWSIDVDRFVVHVTSMNVTGADAVLTASAAAVVFDLAKGSTPVLTASARKARLWESFDFEIGPAAEGDLVLTGNVAAEDGARLQKDGLSILVEGAATYVGDPSQKKTFSWGFTTDTVYSECDGGIVVPPNGTNPTTIVFRADVLFATDPAEPNVLHFKPFADADADGNGAVTLEELHAQPDDLGAVVEKSTQNLVGSYGGTGKCKSTPAGGAD